MRDFDIESDLKQEKFQSLKLVQGDRGNKIKINVYEDGQPVNLTGCSIAAKYKRSDGEIVNGTVENISGNSFDAVMDSDITKASGTLKMIFTIEKDDVKVSTFLLLADVREGIGENTGSSGGSTGGGSTSEVTIDLSQYYKKTETYSKAQIDSQFKDIANNQPTDLSLDSATNLLQLVNSKGSKLGNGITLPISSGGGTSQYLHIKYSSTGAPQLAGQISDTPNAYIGLCVDTNADSPTNPRSYTWYQWKGDNGDTGATPNLQIGTVTTLDSGINATASITGTTENPLLNLGIPKGENGTGGSSDTLVTTNISGTTLSLTTDKYQTATVVDGTEITLPTVTSFTEIHLFFGTTTDLTLILPSCKWQNGNTPTISANKTYEFIFTYTTEWLGGVIEYV